MCHVIINNVQNLLVFDRIVNRASRFKMFTFTDSMHLQYKKCSVTKKLNLFLHPNRTLLFGFFFISVFVNTVKYPQVILSEWSEHQWWGYDTKYVHIKSTTVYAPRRNWDSPNPPPAG